MTSWHGCPYSFQTYSQVYVLTYAHCSWWSIGHLRPLAIALCSGLLWPFQSSWSLVKLCFSVSPPTVARRATVPLPLRVPGQVLGCTGLVQQFAKYFMGYALFFSHIFVFQGVKVDAFQMFDYGSAKANIDHYKQVCPFLTLCYLCLWHSFIASYHCLLWPCSISNILSFILYAYPCIYHVFPIQVAAVYFVFLVAVQLFFFFFGMG